MALLFQYGSNNSVGRLNSKDRLAGDAVVRGLVLTEQAWTLDFDVWSNSNQCWASDIRQPGDRRIWGVLYEIPDYLVERDTANARGRRSMDEIEGVRYARVPIEVRWRNGRLVKQPVFTYTVKAPTKDTQETSLAYVTHILNGLRDHRAPAAYVAYVKKRIVISNPQLAANLNQL